MQMTDKFTLELDSDVDSGVDDVTSEPGDECEGVGSEGEGRPLRALHKTGVGNHRSDFRPSSHDRIHIHLFHLCNRLQTQGNSLHYHI